MTARKPRKTVSGAASNPALSPNPDRLIVGDTAPRPREKDKPKRVPFGSYIDPELHKELKIACAVDGLEIRDALDQALRLWLEHRTTDEPAS